MARVVINQNNLWGKSSGIDPQRSDLWIIDFSQALSGLNGITTMPGIDTVLSGRTGAATMSSGLTTPYVPANLASYYANTVALPELKVRSEAVRRDARAYPMPSWDDPCEAVRITFVLDCFKPGGSLKNPYQSEIYQMLDTWRAVVRAGRGSMSSEYAITLDNNYRIDYCFDLNLTLLRPSSSIAINPTADDPALVITNDLEFSMQFRLINAWLSSFRMSELSYEGTKMMQLDALFYIEDILQEPQPQSIAPPTFNPANTA